MPFRELPVAGRCEEFLVAVGKNFQANRIQRPHLAFGRLVLALDGLQATDAGQVLQFLFDVVFDPRKKQHP